ncbi:MAG TPA: hypothetical protein VFD74_08980 [Thermoleophilia bacterium]|nr:hypothetical protein [Thermoleophilia bacterium]
MEKRDIQHEVEQVATDGRLDCHTARVLAEKLGVGYADVGAAADEAGVKIHSCELGCF